MTLFMLVSALVTSYMCYVEGRAEGEIYFPDSDTMVPRRQYLYATEDIESSCNTPSGARGQCISLYDCPPLMSLVSNPNKSRQDVELLRRSQCGFLGDTPAVCCPPAPTATCFTPDSQEGKCIGVNSCAHIAQMLRPPVPQDTVDFVRNSRCDGPEQYSICCGPPRMSIPSPQPPIQNGVCTMTAAPPDPRSRCCGVEAETADKIVGGEATAIDQYPWLVIIEYAKENKIKLLCGGALISGKYVLTAGHCVAGAVLNAGTPRNVRLGDYNVANDGQDCAETAGGGVDCTPGAVIVGIEKTIPHPEYNPNHPLKRHDIALIRLRQMAPYTEFIRPICLPTTDLTATPPANFILYAAGWGAVNDNVGKSDIKLHVGLPFVPKDQCQPAYGVPRRNIPLGVGQICAGGEAGKDSCKGDSGGPLVYQNDRIYEVIGVVSFGPSPCGMENIPGVYTKVYEYNPWIRSQIKP